MNPASTLYSTPVQSCPHPSPCLARPFSVCRSPRIPPTRSSLWAERQLAPQGLTSCTHHPERDPLLPRPSPPIPCPYRAPHRSFCIVSLVRGTNTHLHKARETGVYHTMDEALSCLWLKVGPGPGDGFLASACCLMPLEATANTALAPVPTLCPPCAGPSRLLLLSVISSLLC